MLCKSYNHVPESHRRAALEQALYMLHDPRMFARGVLVQHRKGIPPELESQGKPPKPQGKPPTLVGIIPPSSVGAGCVSPSLVGAGWARDYGGGRGVHMGASRCVRGPD